ncbi:MAG TPA: hypothetical protein VJ899_12520 [Salegentibacter sp.]|nr:hypothetical protein [Salegentibacter sp.]
MSIRADENSNERAADLMLSFAKRTGIVSEEGNSKRRYLWTDAFALLNFLALNRLENKIEYEKYALRLIDLVHHTLGKFAENDERRAWISGLNDEEAEKHPTIAGLRIGKKLPERAPNEPFDQRLEWERDGQYYHYHTRWITALCAAKEHFNNSEFQSWAAELSLAGAKFIEEDPALRMYWKMSVDLSRPLVPSMGAHDPMEGLLCALQVRNTTDKKQKEFELYISNLKNLCSGIDWSTTDALGLGGLLLNVVRAAKLQKEIDLPASVRPQKLLSDAEKGLKSFAPSFRSAESAQYRLAFRECGLSLGLRVLEASLNFLEKLNIHTTLDPEIFKLADKIEGFWTDKKNQKSPTFRDHLDINEVSLASSLLARSQPEIFGRA